MMANFGEINWEVLEAKTIYNEKHPALGGVSFDFFLNYCRQKLPSSDLLHSCHFFLQEQSRLSDEVKKSIELIAQQPFLTAFLVWIKETALDPSNRLAAKTLLEQGFIGIHDKENQVWTLSCAKLFDHRNVIEAIRCRREWHFLLRENLVKTYISFMHWLYTSTYGYIPQLEDPDLCRSQGRSLDFINFTHFLSKLKEDDQLVAKLLYFGGSRTLEEVLAINIAQIDFNRQLINFGLLPVSYPLHVFAHISNLMQGRIKGRIFLGRRGNALALNPATIFRNFKEAALEVGLGKDFTPKLLTTNI